MFRDQSVHCFYGQSFHIQLQLLLTAILRKKSLFKKRTSRVKRGKTPRNEMTPTPDDFRRLRTTLTLITNDSGRLQMTSDDFG